MTRTWGLLAAAAALLVAVAAAPAGETTLKEHKWDAGKCTVLIPGTPKELTNKGVSPGGTPVETSMLLVDGGKHVYLVAFTPNAELAKASDELKKKALDDGRDAAVRSVKGKLLNEKDVKTGDLAGREFQVDAPGLGVYRARMFIVGDRLYQLVVAGPKDIAQSKDADKFLDSFKVNK
jgi:hypothetical protein